MPGDLSGLDVLRRLRARAAPPPVAILTGPEGGFTDEERAQIRNIGGVIPISLGPRILRAETAAIAATAIAIAEMEQQ